MRTDGQSSIYSQNARLGSLGSEGYGYLGRHKPRLRGFPICFQKRGGNKVSTFLEGYGSGQQPAPVENSEDLERAESGGGLFGLRRGFPFSLVT